MTRYYDVITLQRLIARKREARQTQALLLSTGATQDASQCDCCGKYKPDCKNILWHGMDTHACAVCRNEDDDPASDRGDWEYHQRRDQ